MNLFAFRYMLTLVMLALAPGEMMDVSPEGNRFIALHSAERRNLTDASLDRETGAPICHDWYCSGCSTERVRFASNIHGVPMGTKHIEVLMPDMVRALREAGFFIPGGSRFAFIGHDAACEVCQGWRVWLCRICNEKEISPECGWREENDGLCWDCLTD